MILVVKPLSAEQLVGLTKAAADLADAGYLVCSAAVSAVIEHNRKAFPPVDLDHLPERGAPHIGRYR